MHTLEMPQRVARRVAATLRSTPLEAPARVARRFWWDLSGRIPQHERYDRMTAEIIRRVTTPLSNCIDVGANRGAVLRVMVDAAPLGAHVAFEPLPDHAERLRIAFPEVDVRALALADARGEVSFTHVVDAPAYSGFRDRSEELPGLTSTTITVAVSRLDDELDPDAPVDLIKIDVEGAEYDVLRGGIETLRRWQPFVIFEHGRGGADLYGSQPEAVYDLLAAVGLSVSTLGDWLDHAPALDRVGFTNAFATGREYVFVAHR